MQHTSFFPQGYALYPYPIHTNTLSPGPSHMVAENVIHLSLIVQLIHGPQPQAMTTFNLNTPPTVKPPSQRQVVHGKQDWIGALRKFSGNIEEKAGQWFKEFEALASGRTLKRPYTF